MPMTSFALRLQRRGRTGKHGRHALQPAGQRACTGVRRLGAVLLLPMLLAGMPDVRAQPAGLPELGDSASIDLSPRVEQRLGDALMIEGRRDPTYISDPAINQYLTDMGRRLAGTLPGTPPVNVF